MKKMLMKCLLLAAAFMVVQQKAKAQPFCPMVYNNATKIGLINVDLYNAIQGGTYTLNFISSQLPDQECWISNVPVTVVKSQNVINAINGGTGGWGVYFDIGAILAAQQCSSQLPVDTQNFPDWNAIQSGGLSIELKPVPGQGGNMSILVNMTDFGYDDCIINVVPVIWGPFTASLATFPNRVNLNWSTYTEQDVDHFSIEKSINGGVSWHKIAQVPAVGNSQMQQFYSYIDYSPLSPRGYYRIVSVDIDCSRQYSLVRFANCSNCATVFNPPSVTPDCPPPNTSPYISGPATICDFSSQIYRLNNVKGDVQVTWSIWPSNLANLTPVSRMVGLVPTGNSGSGTLTAKVVKTNGDSSFYNYNITFGPPSLYGWCWNGPMDYCNNSYEFTAQISMLPGTNWYDYHWYQDGFAYLGTGDQKTWNLWQGQTVYFEVYYYGPCGTSVWYGSSNGCDMPWKGTRPEPVAASKVPFERHKLIKNPARDEISIQRIPPCEIEPFKGVGPRVATGSKSVTIKVLDVQGAVRKTSSVNASSTRININVSDLTAGMYFVHIIENGQKTETLKVLVEK
jgi:hypothetical protein